MTRPTPLKASSHSGPPPAKFLLNFSYRLHPTREQEVWLGETSEQLRHWWNALVGEQKHAHRQIVSGHPEHTRAKLAKRAPKMTGMRAAKLAKSVAEHGGDAEAGAAALAALDHERIGKASKSGLEVEYAIARVTDLRQGDTGSHLGAAFAQVVGRFRKAWQACWNNKPDSERRSGPPRFRRFGETMPITRQWQSDWAWIDDNNKQYVNISALLPHRVQCLPAERSCVEVVVHRPLPASAKVKELKIKRHANRWELTLAIEVSDSDYYHDDSVTGTTCGIDPGRATAATMSSLDGTRSHKLTPGRPMRRAERRLAYLQQRLDRQRRANNPDCYRADGTWIKGKRARVTSVRMRRTEGLIAKVHQRVADVRKTYWGQEAAALVGEYDQIFIGDWKPATAKSKGIRRRKRKGAAPRARGAAATERGQNRTDTDHSLGQFRARIAERATRSAAPKLVHFVQEPNTTRMCIHCAAVTGPTGVAGLAVRHWACSACGKSQDRDIGAAINIARRGMESMAHRDSGQATGQNARRPSSRNDPKVAARSASAQIPKQRHKSSSTGAAAGKVKARASITARSGSRKPAVVQRMARDPTQ
jgi:transposase